MKKTSVAVRLSLLVVMFAGVHTDAGTAQQASANLLSEHHIETLDAMGPQA